MSADEPDPDDAGSDRGPSSGASPFLRPGERMPWVLRQPTRDLSVRPEDRETDRLAALAARRMALVVISAVGVGWLLVAALAGEGALRIATLVALVVCVTLAVRAAITTQRFLRRWMEPESLVAPPIWITLATLAAAVAVFVAASNVVADVQADRPATRAIVFATLSLAVVGVGAFMHLAGGRSIGAALRERFTPE